MNASHTIPDSFDDYVDRYIGRADAPAGWFVEHEAELRDMHARELLGQRQHPAPADMPPCPSWCATPGGHEYDSLDDLDLDAGLVTLIRFHVSAEHYLDDSFGYISQQESRRGGLVSLLPPIICLSVDGSIGVEDVDSAEARKRAAALLNLADKLDTITAQL